MAIEDIKVPFGITSTEVADCLQLAVDKMRQGIIIPQQLEISTTREHEFEMKRISFKYAEKQSG
jgi:hypothetical protein